MPTARRLPDGELTFNIGSFAGMTRFTYGAQFAPRLYGAFRYTEIKDYNAADFSTYYDRSFDLRFTALTETALRPEITIGLQDFIGTGIYSGEFIAASKQISPNIEASLGMGWGRFGSANRIAGFGTRPVLTPDVVDEGGEANFDTLFRGDIGLFGGLSWRVNDKFTLKAEYSSDDYALEDDELGIFNLDHRFNFGAEYQVVPGFNLGAYYLYGSEFGLKAEIAWNPYRPPIPGSIDGPAPPVKPRPSRAASPASYSGDWVAVPGVQQSLRTQLSEALAPMAINLDAVRFAEDRVIVHIRNAGYESGAQAIGRTARVLSILLPASVETFTIVQNRLGMALPAVSLSRSALEEYETAPDGTEQMLAHAVISENPPRAAAPDLVPGEYPRTAFRLAPYVRASFFDPNDPLKADLGIRAGAGIVVSPGLIFSGSVRKSLVGNLGDDPRPSDSVLPHVRSDFPLYDQEGDPGIEHLTGAYYTQPGRDLYGRLTVGYLETMYGGISSELLWAPSDSRLAFGGELNYVEQRDFDGGLGFQDYSIWTGHASAYYRVTDDFFVQLDAGRYLAGDYGGTVTIERVFTNGWRVGAFATFTDVSAEDFGEGSFDKGLTMTVPLGWLFGKSSSVIQPLTLRPITRDGGARLRVDGRLYETIEPSQNHRLEQQWGRFWR